MKQILLSMTLLGLIPMSANAESCKYSFNPSTAELTWTGYKFTEKTGVPGTFDKIDWQAATNAPSLSELIKTVTFTIDATTVNSANAGRDLTLKDKFFALIDKNGLIEGKGIGYDQRNNKAMATLTFNGITQDIMFDVKDSKNKLTMSSSIDILEQFKMTESFNSIAAACKALHIGKDGKAVTWSEVGVQVTADYKKKCA